MLQHVSCDACEFKAKVYFSHRAYMVPELEYGLPIRANLGWCFDCDNAIPIEHIPEMQQLESELQFEIENPRVIESDLQMGLTENNHLIWAKSRLNWRRTRKSPQRCLICGGSDIIDLGERLAVKRDDIIGLHPSCLKNGNLLHQGGGLVNYLAIEPYSPDGQRLETESDDG